MQIVRLPLSFSEHSGVHSENSTVVSQMIISSNNSLAWHVLLSLSLLRSFLIFLLPFGFSHSLSLQDRFASSPTQWVCYVIFFQPLPSSASDWQMWIIKWWIRGYFLPSHCQFGWAWLHILSHFSCWYAVKSERCRSFFFFFFFTFSGWKPAHPSISSAPGHRGLDAAGRNSYSNKNQSSSSVDEFVHAVNLAVCDNVIIAHG